MSTAEVFLTVLAFGVTSMALLTMGLSAAATRRRLEAALRGMRAMSRSISALDARVTRWSEDRDTMRAELNRTSVQLAELKSVVRGGPPSVHLTYVPESAVPACSVSGCSELAEKDAQGYCRTHAKERGLV